jgi:hypothetical protein
MLNLPEAGRNDPFRVLNGILAFRWPFGSLWNKEDSNQDSPDPEGPI